MLNRLKKNRVAKDTGWMMLGQGANLVTQALCFLLLARLLGVRECGIFAGAFALVSIVAPYSTLGANMVFMRYVSGDRSAAGTYWGNMLATMTLGTLVLTAVVAAAGPMFTHIHEPTMFVLLVVANCFFGQIVTGASAVFQTFGKMRWSALLISLSNALRLVAVVILWVALRHATAAQWSVAFLAVTVTAAVIAMVMVRREIGPAAVEIGLIWRRVGEGFGFAFAGTTESVYNDVDKTMLAHYGLTVQNGFYSMAYRIVDMGTAPIKAVDSAVLPRYFHLSHVSFREVVRLAVKSTRAGVTVGLAVSVGSLLCAPLVPHLAGRDFAGAIVALRWLCWLPPIRAVHRLVGGVLTGTGNQNLRTGAQVTVSVLNVGLNAWWIPAFGWIGAAWSSVATDGLLAVLSVLLVIWLSYRQGRRSPAAADESSNETTLEKKCRTQLQA